MATTVDHTWQMHFTTHGKCIHIIHDKLHFLRIQHTSNNVTYNSSDVALSTESLHTTHLCLTSMAGTRLLTVATCYMPVLRFDNKTCKYFSSLQVFFSSFRQKLNGFIDTCYLDLPHWLLEIDRTYIHQPRV